MPSSRLFGHRSIKSQRRIQRRDEKYRNDWTIPSLSYEAVRHVSTYKSCPKHKQSFAPAFGYASGSRTRRCYCNQSRKVVAWPSRGRRNSSRRRAQMCAAVSKDRRVHLRVLKKEKRGREKGGGDWLLTVQKSNGNGNGGEISSVEAAWHTGAGDTVIRPKGSAFV